MISTAAQFLQVWHDPFCSSSSPVRKWTSNYRARYWNHSWTWGNKRWVPFRTTELGRRWRWQLEWEIWNKTNQRATLNYRKLFLMLKPHSLELLEGKGKSLIPSDIFLSEVEQGWQGWLCAHQGVTDFVPIFLETHFPGNILHHPTSGSSRVLLCSGQDLWPRRTVPRWLHTNPGGRISPSSSSPSLAALAIPMEEALFASSQCENSEIAWPGHPHWAGAETGMNPKSLEPHLTHYWTFLACNVLPSLLPLYPQEAGTNVIQHLGLLWHKKIWHTDALARGTLSWAAFVKRNSTFPQTSWSPI